jgi:hypothetical protein
MIRFPKKDIKQPKLWYAAYSYTRFLKQSDTRGLIVMSYLKARDPGAAWRATCKRFADKPKFQRPIAVMNAKYVPETAVNYNPKMVDSDV